MMSSCENSLILRSSFGAVQAGYGVGIPSHIGQNHHHIAAGASYIIRHRKVRTIVDEDIQADESSPEANVYVSFKLHDESFILSTKITVKPEVLL